jgi:NADH-quinone oxidoreductase subunit N
MNIVQDLWSVSPELFLLAMSCFVLILDLFLSPKYKAVSYTIVQLSICVTIALCGALFGQEQTVFSDQFKIDTFSQGFKIIILVMVLFIMVYGRAYLKVRKMAMSEYQILVLFSTLGMMCLASANSLLVIYLGLELFSLPLYTLVALNRDSAESIEAGMKYFIMGSLASGFLLYGFSLLFGLSGSLILANVATHIWAAHGAALALYLLALVFVVVGITFKLGAVPFHMWIPDVYQGATSSVSMLISSVSKVAAFVMAYRLLAGTLPDLSQVFGAFFVIFAILSLILGNVVAIAQTNLKRMLGYSAIGQLGFIFLGLAVGPFDNYSAVTFYIIVYTALALGAFATIVLISPAHLEYENISDFKGLAQRSPWLAFLMMLLLFAFAGVPPTVGFYAKFVVLKALVNVGLTWVAVLAVIFAVIGAFYYIRVIKAMYFDKPESLEPITVPLDARLAISINGLAALGLGIFPAPLFLMCQRILGG